MLLNKVNAIAPLMEPIPPGSPKFILVAWGYGNLELCQYNQLIVHKILVINMNIKNIFYLIIVVPFLGTMPNCIPANNNLELIRSKELISKIEMKISSPGGLKNIDITDSTTLDSVNKSLNEAKEIFVQKGGAFEIWADVKIYKSTGIANFMVQHSAYNGWMIEVDGKTLKCGYMYYLVKFYYKNLAG